MTNIEKQFVPYEQSLKLRELGYNKSCFGWNFINSEVLHLEYINNQTDYELLRPLWQQAFNWFRDKKGLMSYIKFTMGYGYDAHSYHICDTFAKIGRTSHVGELSSYEEARIACLNKLIELAQEKKRL